MKHKVKKVNKPVSNTEVFLWYDSDKSLTGMDKQENVKKESKE